MFRSRDGIPHAANVSSPVRGEAALMRGYANLRYAVFGQLRRIEVNCEREHVAAAGLVGSPTAGAEVPIAVQLDAEPGLQRSQPS